MVINEDVYLEHFGVKGMRWGVRKKEPVSAERQAKREKKAQKYEAKAAVLDTKIKQLQSKRSYTTSGFYRKQNKIFELQVEKNQAFVDAKKKREGKLTDKQRKLVKGAAITGALLAAYGTYQAAQGGQFRSAATRGKAFITKTPMYKTDARLSADMAPEALHHLVASKINPGYGAPGTKMNCRRATFAYEMRRRGYDVAATRTTNGRGQHAGGLFNVMNFGRRRNVGSGRLGPAEKFVSETVKKKVNPSASTPFHDMFREGNPASGWKHTIESGRSGIFRTLSKQPSGARGELGVLWKMGGGHSMAWEIVDGKPVIFDTQRGKMYKSLVELNKDVGENIAAAGFTRLDNIPLDQSFLSRWVRNA